MPYIINPNCAHLGGNAVGGDPQSMCPKLWDWIIAKYNVKSILDIGCGEGYCMEQFKIRGIDVYGVDGLAENIDEVKKRGLDGIVFDLTKGFYKHSKNMDMIWCCELVEHVESKFLDNVLKTFLNSGLIAMTHAVPGQGGYHHVNCKDDNYWKNIMDATGFKYLADETIYSRTLDRKKHWQRSGMIFGK
jgi:SAM-dependent methyltransferase